VANSFDFRIIKNQQVTSHGKSKNDRIWGFSTVSADSCTFQKTSTYGQGLQIESEYNQSPAATAFFSAPPAVLEKEARLSHVSDETARVRAT
jgi:hypothetical protein